MENQHRHILGYRELSEEDIAAMNRIKQYGREIEILLQDIGNRPDVDLRWVAIAKTDFQTGFMALTRSVARPTTF